MTYAISAADAVLAVAASHLAVREVPQNRGRFVEYIQRYAGGKPGDPWCAGWVYYCGHHMLKDAWPLPRTMSCDVLLRDAERQGLIVDTPKAGCLFLVINPKNSNDAVHVGFVERPRPDKGAVAFETLEGNSNDLGERDGIGVFRNVRGTPEDKRLYRFVDWEAALAVPE